MRKSRLSRYKQSRLTELFVAGTTARTASSLVGINKTSASYYFQRLRQLIYDNSEHMELLEGEIEADESYFEGRRKGQRGRGTVTTHWAYPSLNIIELTTANYLLISTITLTE